MRFRIVLPGVYIALWIICLIVYFALHEKSLAVHILPQTLGTPWSQLLSLIPGLISPSMVGKITWLPYSLWLFEAVLNVFIYFFTGWGIDSWLASRKKWKHSQQIDREGRSYRRAPHLSVRCGESRMEASMASRVGKCRASLILINAIFMAGRLMPFTFMVEPHHAWYIRYTSWWYLISMFPYYPTSAIPMLNGYSQYNIAHVASLIFWFLFTSYLIVRIGSSKGQENS